MATAKVIADRAEWNARAITLAEEGHLVNRARYLGEGIYEEALWQVPSKSSDGVYVCHVWALTEGVTCNCKSGVYGRACSHAGSALQGERQRQQAMRAGSQDEAWRWWMHGGDWE